MLTTLDKAIVAVLLPLLIWANQKWGLTLPVDADTWLPIVAAVGGLLVYAIPNKAASSGVSVPTATKPSDAGNVGIRPALALGAAALLALMLSGCAGTQTKVDETLQNQNVQTGIQLACATFTGIEAGWGVYAQDHTVSDTATQAVAAAEAAVGTICTVPYPTDTATLIATVTQAGVAVMTALQDAEAEQTAGGS